MKILPTVQYLWATSFVVQLIVCGMLIYRGHFRRLPFFTTYILLNLLQVIFLYLLYGHYGKPLPRFPFVAAWLSEAITLLARICATVEVLQFALQSYRGIWALGWRLLVSSSLLVLIFVAALSRGDAGWGLMEADRSYHLIFAVALIAVLFMIRYYFVALHWVYRTLLGGFCFYSCIKIVSNTVLQGWLYPRFSHFEAIWQTLAIAPYLVVLIIWATALARPLPAREAGPDLAASVYRQVRPELNYQLQAINTKLMDFLKIEDRGQ